MTEFLPYWNQIYYVIAIKYSYLIDDNDENKKSKDTKTCVLKLKLKVEDYKHCLEPTQVEKEMNYLEKDKLAVNSLRANHKEIITNNKIKLK